MTLLWLMLGLMAVAAIVILTVPLFRIRSGAEAPRAALDVALFRDQLAELDREAKEGLIAGPEATAARREIERRLIAAGRTLATSDTPAKPVNRAARRRLALVLTSVIVPSAFLLYLGIGTPQAPEFLQIVARERAQEAAQRAELAHLVALVEQRLTKEPDDGEGWALIAAAEVRLGKLDEGRRDLAKARELLPPAPAAEAMARFGDALIRQFRGQYIDEVKQLATEAVTLDPQNGRARMLLAIAAMQGGDPQGAREVWEKTVAELPPDSPWVAQAKAALQAMERVEDARRKGE